MYARMCMFIYIRVRVRVCKWVCKCARI